MEQIIQIILNIVILSGMAWFVFREAAGRYITKQEFDRLGEKGKEIRIQNNKNIEECFDNSNKYNANAHTNLSNRIAEIENMLAEMADTPLPIIPNQSELIKEGAEIAERCFKLGSSVVTDAIYRSGMPAPTVEVRKRKGPIVIDDLASEVAKDDEKGLPDVIMKMNEKINQDLAAMSLKRERE